MNILVNVCNEKLLYMLFFFLEFSKLRVAFRNSEFIPNVTLNKGEPGPSMKSTSLKSSLQVGLLRKFYFKGQITLEEEECPEYP